MMGTYITAQGADDENTLADTYGSNSQEGQFLRELLYPPSPAKQGNKLHKQLWHNKNVIGDYKENIYVQGSYFENHCMTN